MNRIADLPGYGFARVSKQTQKEWAKLITAYLNSRQSLRGLVIIMDIRHPFKESDLTLIDWCSETNTPLLIVLNKSDKLSKSGVLREVEKANLMLKQMNLKGQALGFSSTKTTGIEKLDEKLKRWFDV
jgi:GTP-binding protein